MGRKVMAILGGLSVGIMIILIMRTIALAYYPFPADLVWNDPTDMDTYAKDLPNNAFIILVVSHIVGVFLGALIAALISKKNRFVDGVICGAIIFICVMLFNFSMDFPDLYIVIDALCTAAAGLAGAAFGKGRNV